MTTLQSPLPEPSYEIDPPLVLLAEDDDMFRQLLSGILRRDGYNVLEAKDGARLRRLVEELLQSGRDTRPELIISDVRMPGPSGLAVLELLRAYDWYTPVILMTAFGGPEVEARARQLGAATVFSKPFALEDFRRRVQDILPTL
jgi:CheY-like chemotaxis protein